ncbi:hypothetical protein O6H91_20G031200 [Diphasiastrum complanatum]|uniref:Uncharacterized protein n=1 Tax=Diphasiastrum complanatum TaxID=34168 RepID=A0ACC2ANX3_DIPCM|nr:hypothetical protein O6H91_20G031200 [Diphasiastrum complanatum]
MGGSSRQVTLLYRSLLGLIHKHGMAPALPLIPSSRAAELCGLPDFDGLPPYDINTLEGASLILRWAFKENATLAIGSVEGENAIDRGFEALRLFNLLKSIHERGVIYGWDATRMISHDSIAKSACSELPG